jgi:predicted ATPase
MMPRIRTVQIKNYKSLAAVSVQLEPFTVFVGPNGSGKSNFIDALAFVQESVSETVDLALKRRGGLPTIISALEDRRPLRYPQPQIPEEQRQEFLDRDVASAAGLGFRLILDLIEDMRADYSLEISMFEDGGFIISRERCVVENSSGDRDAFEVKNGRFVQEIEGITPILFYDRLALYAASATKTFRPVFEFLASMRFYSIVPDALRVPQDPDLGYSLRRDGSNAAAVLKNILIYGGTEGGLRDRLVRLLALVADGVADVQNYQVGTQEIVRFKQDIGLSQPSIFPAVSMSDGTLRALGLLLAIYQPTQLKVVGIEEPEATIHPAIAEVIMQVLMDAANERQILVTTHSPDILDQKGLKETEIRSVTWSKGRTLVGDVSAADRQAIRERLYTVGELLRIGELRPEEDPLKQTKQEVDLFGKPFVA